MSTVKDLKKQCKEQNLTGYSKMKKSELVEYLKNNNTTGGTNEKEKNEEEHKVVKVGIHVFKNNDISESITAARSELPLNAVQIFTHGPRSTTKSKHNYESIRENSKGINIYVHSSYPTNPWNGKDSVIKHTIDQFISSQELGSRGVVLHIPKIGPVEVAKPVKLLVDILLKNNLLKNQKVILEMKAVKQHATESYESPEKINRLIEALKEEGLTENNVGICIDTAHIYAGKAEINTYEEGVEYFKALKYPEWICLIHLNGNAYDAKERAGDKHALPFDHEDKIWKENTYKNSGCRAFIEFAKRVGIDFILEIKPHHKFEDVKVFINSI